MKTDRLLDAALETIAHSGWSEFSFIKVAEDHNIPVSELLDRFPCRSDVPTQAIKQIDQIVLEELEGETFEGASPREVIFEILMTRFEAALPYKACIAVFWREWPADMLSALMVASKGVGSIGWILDRAGLNSTGIKGLMRLQGLTALYLWTVKCWLEDETEDMSQTMAALDQGLDRTERIAKALQL